LPDHEYTQHDILPRRYQTKKWVVGKRPEKKQERIRNLILKKKNKAEKGYSNRRKNGQKEENGATRRDNQ
jgi:hypothetical protein